MNAVIEAQELIEAPLSREELAVRYRRMCDDPCLTNVPGKLELDVWGRLVMTPPATYHGLVQGRLAYQLKAVLGGEVFTEVAIATATGLFLPDVAWASGSFMAAYHAETPLMRAPEICIEVVSPSNSLKEMTEKLEAYLAAGAKEVWLVYTKSRRCQFYGPAGQLPGSTFAVDLSEIFA